jgi:hypothetical protein
MAAPATLSDVVGRLRAEGQLTRNTGTNSIKSLNNALLSLTSAVSVGLSAQTLKLSETLDFLTVWKNEDTIRRQLDRASADRPAGAGAGAGAGANISALGGGLLRGGAKAAAGAGLLGLAMPAFFGGLMAGDATLGWLSQFGSGFNFDNLKAAAIGFTDMIADIDERSLVTLGAIMGISAIGGTKAALGLGSMGVAISAFLGGLLVGDGLFSGVTALGGNLNFSGMKSALVGFSDMIIGLKPDALTALGVLMTGSAVAGMIGKDPLGASKSLGSMGIAISAFLGGLLAGDAIFAGVSALGGSLDFGSMKKVLAGFSSSISALTPEAGTALAAIIGASGVAAAFGVGPKEALGMASIMTGIGAGISGLMLGLFGGSAGIEWLQKSTGATGAGMASAFKMFNDSVGELNNENAIIALGAIIGAGSVIGGLIGPAGGLWAAGGIFAVMTGIGLGISGLMLGLFGGSAGIEWLQKSTGATGAGMVSAFKMFNDSIVQITPEAITKMKDLVALGGIDLVGALGGLGAGIVALMGAGGLAQIGAAAKEGLLAGVDWLFGTNLADGSKSTIEFLVDSLDPLKKLDMTLITKMDGFGQAIDRFASSFATLGKIDAGKSSIGLTKMMKDLGGMLTLMDHAMTGEPFNPNSGVNAFMKNLFGNEQDIITFGPGLNNMDMSKITNLTNFINSMRGAFSGGGGADNLPGGAGNDTLSTKLSTQNFANNLDSVMGRIARVEGAAMSGNQMNPTIVVNAPTVAPVNNRVTGATNVSNQRVTSVGTGAGMSGIGRFAN